MPSMNVIEYVDENTIRVQPTLDIDFGVLSKEEIILKSLLLNPDLSGSHYLAVERTARMLSEILQQAQRAGVWNAVQCSLCHNWATADKAHRHQHSWIGDECCWDERLRSSE